ncbi:hypothetical protein J6I90_09955 [Pseudidiomarina sp. 1APP75-32.1]|uniref:Inovirus Gp2 family protein n=1 Tax=Pseudidiomarina terrestris TaxID=2820060 RepID=A0AAW7QZL5_9GAMM|nr:hypothetical protein [Pseudidiomarina sp. 1APP75-32.1]MDN7125204.1 hypothetical protein [Pseudidiomarina sp. 1APP75-32.1]
MTIMKIVADYKIKAAKRREQEAAYWRKIYCGTTDTFVDNKLSQELNHIRSEVEQRADHLVLEYLRSPKEVKRRLFSSDTVALANILLEQNCDFPDSFVRPMRGRTAPADADIDYEQILRKKLLEALTVNVELSKAKYQNQQSTCTATDGFKCNPAYRSYYLQLKGIAGRSNKLLTAVTVTFPRDTWGKNFTAKTRTKIKNSLRRVLAKVAGEHNKYAVYSFEESKDGTYHLHALIVVAKSEIEQLQKELRKLASSASNSVLLKHKPLIGRLMSTGECRMNNATMGNATIKYSSCVTRGFADYISKDLGKLIGDGRVRSSIVTINPGRGCEVNYAAYKDARSVILSICARRIEEVFRTLGTDELISTLINQHPICRRLIEMMTDHKELKRAA